MAESYPTHGPPGRLLTFAAGLSGAETAETAIARTVEVVEAVFDGPVASVCARDPATGTITTHGAAVPAPDRITDALGERTSGGEDGRSADDPPEAIIDTDPEGPFHAEVTVPVGHDRVLRVGATKPGELDETAVATIEGVAATLEASLSRIENSAPEGMDRELASALFEQSDDATFVSDADGGLVAVNRAAVTVTGRDRDARLASGLPEVCEDSAAAAVRSHLERAVTGASTPVTAAIEYDGDGDRTVEFTSHRIDVGGMEYVRTVAHDPSSDAQPQSRPETTLEDDTAALRRLTELAGGSEAVDPAVERLLSLGCDRFGLDTGILSHVDGDDCEVEVVVDATGTHEVGAVYDLGDTMCEATLAGGESGVLAFADVADTEHRSHPAAGNVRAYIAAPVVVDGDTHGTVNFSMGAPRASALSRREREFVTLVAQWIGIEVERRRRVEELERYETILEAVGDPVYALDADGRVTFVNAAAEREFGYGESVIGKYPSIGMEESDVERVRRQVDELKTTDERSKTAEFTLETADGEHRIVENRIALLGDGEFRGAAGVLRDVTAREEQRRQLELFQRAVEEAADGVAVLENEVYTYVDDTHVEMYGFDDTEQLLGNSWQKLYDDDEIERLQAEAFPALEADGHWRGMVTGSRPDGSTFPAELSLTIVDDGRLVCTVRDDTEHKKRERELKLKERAMDEASVGIQITDATQEDNPLIYVNEGFERITGYTAAEAVGRNPRFLQTDDVDPEQVATLRNAISAEEPVSLELRNARRDGTPYWSRVSVTPVTDEAGTVRNYIGIQQDVTARRERSQWLRSFLNRGPLMFVETRNVDGEAVVVSCNDRLLTRLGYDRAEVEGKPLASLYTAESAAELEERGYDAALAGEFGMDERTLVTADGDRVHALLRAVPRQDGTDGTSALFVDITERMQREASLEASERRYRSLVENIPNGAVATFDADLRYNLAAGDLLSAFGLDPDDVSGTPAGTLFENEEYDLRPRFCAALDGERTDRRVEIGDRTLRVQIAPIAYDDVDPSDASGLVLAQDVTEEVRHERELVEERERFRLLTESVDEYAFVVVGDDGTVQTWNSGAEELFGHDAEAAVGMPVAELYPAADRESGLPERLREQARIAGESAHDGWHRRGDGSEFYADTRYAPLETDDGRFRGYALIVRDMTDRRRQRRRTERFVEESEDVVTIVDTDGTIRYASGSVTRVFGYDPADLVGENLFDQFHPDDRAGTMEAFFGVVEDSNANVTTECRLRAADGGWRAVQGRYRNMLDDDAIDGILLYLRDITEAKRRARRFEGIFNQAFQFTGLLEPDGTIIEANDTTLEFTGVDRDTVVGCPLPDAPWWPDADAVADIGDAIRRGANGEFVRYETKLNSTDGLATVDLSVKPVIDDNDDISLLVVEGRNITAQKQRRQHLEVMQRILRHNMRNDLTKLRGWAQVLCEETDPDARAEHLGTIERTLDRWAALVEKVAEIRQALSNGAGRTAKRLDPLLEGAVTPVREAHPDATISVDTSDVGSVQVPARLRNAVAELADNAAKSTPDATVDIEGSRPREEWIEIRVADDGPGLPEAEATVLETGEETPLTHGQGLGLWMVRTIVTQAGGDVSAEVTADGTEVRLRVPTGPTPDAGVDPGPVE
jgi:PAS domain S-box-containing protein